MSSLAMRLTAVCPSALKRWMYRHPRVLKPFSRWLKRSVPAEGFAVVTIAAGPNKGRKLAVTRTTPNYYWVNDTYEPHVLAALRSAVGRGMTALDIGAHIGFDTLLLSGLVGDHGAVIAFEPDPANFIALARNCQINGLTNVQLHQQAVAATDGSLSFAADGLTTSHLIADETTDTAGIVVAAVTLDRWQQQTNIKPDFIKIDVENHEAAVLRGSSALLHEHRPTLLIEIHSPESLSACVAILKAVRYRLRSLPENVYSQATLDGAPASARGFTIAHIVAEP